MKVTKRELLERITKLETLTQELEKKIKEILDSCSCIKESSEEEEFIESEGCIQTLTEPIMQQIMPELRCSCGKNNHQLYGCNSFSKDK